MVQALNLMGVLNPRITHVAIDGAVFPEEVEARQVLAVPTVLLNGEVFGQGRMTLEEIVGQAGRRAPPPARPSASTAWSPSTSSSSAAVRPGPPPAIYAARKGIRTGLVSERFGGQVLDTMAIENFISVSHTEGPKLAAALEEHVKDYEVDVMDRQRASAWCPPPSPAAWRPSSWRAAPPLPARTVVLSTGARWRQMGVPGEDEYRNKGVTYCPHCDGPLFKGKAVAVIGGGNSGVEAAIDLAGVVAHVTLIEFDAGCGPTRSCSASCAACPTSTSWSAP